MNTAVSQREIYLIGYIHILKEFLFFSSGYLCRRCLGEIDPVPDLRYTGDNYMHFKNRLAIFPSPAGMSLTKTLPGGE
jgi:hypothetical protein